MDSSPLKRQSAIDTVNCWQYISLRVKHDILTSLHLRKFEDETHEDINTDIKDTDSNSWSDAFIANTIADIYTAYQGVGSFHHTNIVLKN